MELKPIASQVSDVIRMKTGFEGFLQGWCLKVVPYIGSRLSFGWSLI